MTYEQEQPSDALEEIGRILGNATVITRSVGWELFHDGWRLEEHEMLGLLNACHTLRTALAERDAEIERLAALSQEALDFTDHLAGCANCWHDRPCSTRERHATAIRKLTGLARAASRDEERDNGAL